MTVRGVKVLATAALMMWVSVLAASAQVTTGTVAGSIKDSKGGVIPGATAILTSDTRGTKTSPAVTNGTGDFVFANVAPDTYTLEVSMDGFKSLKRSGVVVSSGSRLSLGSLTIEVGGKSETVDVTAEAPVIQAQSGERSFSVSSVSVDNLPIANRSFTALADLAPGVSGGNRTGGGGGRNIMMDGVSTMDTGSNAILLQMNVESIAEVKVLVSGYQAEFGRSSGVQITAVTKSGTNRFRGSLYDVERNSDWNENSKTNILNGNAKTISKQRDWGYSLGGPIGKPGGNNKLFFFYSQEYAPRTAGNDISRFRFPTAAERKGDFSATTDNKGELYPYIKDPRLTGVCSSASQVACFADGGVLGKIPTDQLYQTGLNILNLYPLPNINPVPAGQNYNFELVRPTEKLMGWQPAIRIDYQPMQSLRASFKYSGWAQTNKIINGSLPGFNDSKQTHPVVSSTAVTANYTINSTTFLEATVGHSQNELAGCGLAQGGTGPSFCTSGFPMNPAANRITAGLGALPLLFPDSNVIPHSYYAYRMLELVKPPIWDGNNILMPPSFAWGNRVANAPPGVPYPGFLNINSTVDVSISMTKVSGRHTYKGGFYNTHSYKAQQRGGSFGSLNFSQDTVGTNAFDTSFGFANAAIGSFSQFSQASHYVEGGFVYNNTEGYIQDNWKLSPKLTLDYGVRLVHQQPQYDGLGQAANFLPEKWDRAQAPRLYVAGCANGVSPCTGTNRQAMNPLTGQFLGPNTTVAIGALIPGGNETNGLFLSGKGIAKTTYTWPMLAIAPRVGAAYDVSGNQTFVLRGGGGLFFDRPSGNSIFSQVSNPPTSKTVAVRFGQLQSFGSGGLTTSNPPSLSVFEYTGKLPSSTQWNGGVQMTLPWSSSLDVEYVGQHSFRTLESVNLNSIDLGTAFLASTQDPTVTASATPGATSFAATNPDLLRFYQGYAGISQQLGRGWRTYHSLQLSFNRRFRNGVSFGFNDTIGISDKGNSGARLEHVNGTYTLRADQGAADTLLGNQDPTRHTMKGQFVWDLPDLRSTQSTMRVVGLVINDWQLSGILTASTGSAYEVGFNYNSGGSNVNLTGSNDFAGRIRVVGDTGGGCNYKDVNRQFNTSSFQGPLVNSIGLESGTGYLKGCYSQAIDLALARNIRLPKGRNIQLRLDMFNAPNEARISGRNTTIQLSGPTDPITNTAPQFDPITGLLNNGVNLLSTGAVSPNRSQPKNAGFGAVSSYQGPRTLQAQVRFSF